MLKKYLEERKTLKIQFTIAERFDCLSGALLLTLLIALPFIYALGQVISVYLYYVNYWVFLAVVLVSLLTLAFHQFYLRALKLKNKDIEIKVKTYFLFNQLLLTLLYLIIALLFIFVFIPILMV